MKQVWTHHRNDWEYLDRSACEVQAELESFRNQLCNLQPKPDEAQEQERESAKSHDDCERLKSQCRGCQHFVTMLRRLQGSICAEHRHKKSLSGSAGRESKQQRPAPKLPPPAQSKRATQQLHESHVAGVVTEKKRRQRELQQRRLQRRLKARARNIIDQVDHRRKVLQQSKYFSNNVHKYKPQHEHQHQLQQGLQQAPRPPYPAAANVSAHCTINGTTCCSASAGTSGSTSTTSSGRKRLEIEYEDSKPVDRRPLNDFGESDDDDDFE